MLNKFSLKAIAAGVVTFIIAVGLGLTYLNFWGGSIADSGTYWLYIFAWVIPGYVAAAVAGGSGVANGAMVGVIVGIVSGAVMAMFPNNPPPGVDSTTSFEIGLLIGAVAATLCGLGGLVWEVKRYLHAG